MLLITTSIFLFTLALTQSIPYIGRQQYTYMVICPSSLNPADNFPIRVHFASPVTSETITARLNKTRRLPTGKDEVTILAEKTVSIKNGNTDALIELMVPSKLSWGSFGLTISATGSVTFENSTTLFAKHKSLAIFVQTDKAMYKPSEKVLYRVFVVDRKLSLVDPFLNIEFFDPKGNKIKEEMGVRDKLGIEGELSLSDEPPLGRWKITVTATDTDEKEDYNFEVKEYVLPKFQVTVTLPPYGKVSDTSLRGTATAEFQSIDRNILAFLYTFGKPVEGNVVLTLSKRYGSGYFDVKAIRTEQPLVNGKIQFDIPVAWLKELTRSFEYESFLVHANATETITGVTLDGQAEIRYHEHQYKIEFFPQMRDNFRPGFEPGEVVVKISQQDGRPPVSTEIEKLRVTLTYFTDKPVPGLVQPIPNYKVLSPFLNGDVIKEETVSYGLDVDGLVKFKLNIPNDTATIKIKAVFGEVTSYKEIRRFRSPSDTYLEANILGVNATNPLKIGDVVTIKVLSSVGNINAKYLILSKGHLVKMGDIPIGLSEGELKFVLTRDMAPTSRFVVYYVTNTDEVVADGLNLVMEEIFQNKVSVEFVQSSPQRPKAAVDLKVTADKDSVVRVLTVDLSTKLLAEGNDITQERVKDEMNTFGDSPWILRGWGPSLPYSFSADDVSDIFSSANLKVLTNGDMYRFDLWRLRQNYMVSAKSRSFSSNQMGDVGVAGSGGSDSSATGQIRTNFIETWMWLSDIARNGEVIFKGVVPDTTTTYVASAFAVNTKTGLGVAPSTADLKVFLPFFVNPELPYSLVRNEIAVIQANVFNYLDQDQNVLVTLMGSDDFVGITVGNYNTINTVTGNMTKCIRARKGFPTPVFFNIKPTKVGSLMIIIRAEISKPKAMFDEVRRTLPVKAEGIQKEKNIPILVTFKTMGGILEERDLVYPPELVPDSERTRVTCIGDIFGPSFKNLDSLIRMPYGCGEQNMVNFAPAVFAVVYLNETGRLGKDKIFMDKVKNVLAQGYMRQLLYQRRDGSFSAFGDADKEGSLWLTAFVVKSFAQAHKLHIVFIDPKVVEKAVEFIVKHQNFDGTLNNVGIASHNALQGGTASSDRSIMAYVLIALLEVKNAEIIRDVRISGQLDGAIRKLKDALILKVPEMSSDYEQAIGAYALKQANSTDYGTLLTKLENSANLVQPVLGKKKHWNNPSRSLEVEIASYALLTYAALADKNKGLSILMWLVDNRNPYGGFVSTQDTVVALQAFTEFAALIYSKDVSLTIDICTRKAGVDANKKQLKMDSKNHDVLQYVDFVGKFDQIIVEVKGTGLAMIDINQFYNVVSEPGQAYDLTLNVTEESKTRYVITACARYNIANSRSNMAIMDVGVVSGFKPLKDEVVQTPLMKRLDLSGDNRLNIYFDQIPSTEVCVSVPAQKDSFVASVQSASVEVYSYYDPNNRIMKSYKPAMLEDKNNPLCKACDYKCCNNENVLDLSMC